LKINLQVSNLVRIFTKNTYMPNRQESDAYFETPHGKRQRAFDAISGERDYQDSLGSDRTDGAKHTVGDYIVMLQHYQQELVKAWTKNAGTNEALHIMRKIAGIAVHCMEDHGAPPRNPKTTTHY
jgi:hypothetical protein